uniref:Nucleoside diphosphate kinase n=1 Tax=Odontella aurita TaxID=265563 RepID=A0A7S4IL37_9STRA|mmetsp:Transcript_26723/g.78944  ORF Transcript_26723/g.78944 Transcript_26723/m.78944 type:complete len:154 (+) Transcript_26723:270-731(+)|eukprot:CAMPEP_0113548192 /NCGR_PEP_ID=MMETSP0015_2-20120614/12761_1 /TAXON_ID=2838 /ORGANISM="Odontella" /LENGTH=153 /DNA_ID=CAMNT_0000448803 /DNA_START=246 /DNA_END=707 /DNA_ORIENTATION=- /assembly_acc=CAM_ASM_000160
MERTFIMIKPDGVQSGLVGDIISRFEAKGYKLVAMKLMRTTREIVEEHYAEMRRETFFLNLIDYMMSGPVVSMVWEGTDVIYGSRRLIGATMPRNAKMGSIRGDFSVDIRKNACHGSDSKTSAKSEIALWFPDQDCPTWNKCTDPWVNENPDS